MKTIYLILILISFNILLNAEEYREMNLKNGYKIIGKIINQTQDSITVETQSKELIVFNLSEISYNEIYYPRKNCIGIQIGTAFYPFINEKRLHSGSNLGSYIKQNIKVPGVIGLKFRSKISPKWSILSEFYYEQINHMESYFSESSNTRYYSYAENSSFNFPISFAYSFFNPVDLNIYFGGNLKFKKRLFDFDDQSLDDLFLGFGIQSGLLCDLSLGKNFSAFIDLRYKYNYNDYSITRNIGWENIMSITIGSMYYF